MTYVLYGISNCDTVRKARRWLDDHGVDYRFHDFRSDGLDAGRVNQWLASHGWETLVNRRSTSWKALDEKTRASMNSNSASEAILEAPTLIKRPVLCAEASGNDEQLLELGFKADRYAELLT